jgi:hypothetical protein
MPCGDESDFQNTPTMEIQRMEKPDALAFFRGEHRYNCAQAVLKAYAPQIGLGDSCLEKLSRFGNGLAPEGECGALFAAKSILQDPAAKKKTEEEFIRAAGSTKCREIRKIRIFTCNQCVQMASNAVFGHLREGHVLQTPLECMG